MFCPRCKAEYRPGFAECSDCRVELVDGVFLAVLRELELYRPNPSLQSAELGNSILDLPTLLKHGANLNTVDEDASTALMLAAQHGRCDIATALIDAGADLHVQDKTGKTALMRAASQGRSDVVRILIDAGANLNGHDGSGHSALTLALDNIFVPKGARGDCAGTALVLLGAGAELSTGGNDSEPPLFAAALSHVMDGDLDLLRAMVHAGVDLNARGSEGETALMWVDAEGDQLLIDAGADLNAVDDEGRTALIRASSDGDSDLVQVMLKAGANTRARDEKGWTALDHALHKGHHAIVSFIRG